MESHKEPEYRFTKRAHRVLQLAQEEAQRQQRPQIETEHILLALLSEGKIAAQILDNLGLHLQELRATIAGLQPPTPETAPSQTPENTTPSEEPLVGPEAETTLHLAIDEARRLNQPYISPEYFLLALVRQPESLASRALQAHNIQLENVRTATIQLLVQSHKLESSSQSSRNPNASNQGHFDKFTEQARKVLSLSQEEAQRFQHNYIGTEHLLLGLARENEGVAAQALKKMNISLARVRTAVEFILGRGDRIVLGEIGLTPRAKKVIQLAVDEAHLLDQHYIGTEHLLLGLVREGDGIAAGVLESLGIKLEALRETILTILQKEETSDDTTDATEDSTSDDEQPVYQPIDTNNHFTRQTLQALSFAKSERSRLHHVTLGSEHILLGLFSNEQSIPAIVLQELGIKLSALYPAIEALQEREERPYPWMPDVTPIVRALSDISGHEAMRLQSPTIGAEHLLLALLRFPESNAIKILHQLGTDSITLRNKLLEHLQP